jgi:hypothetical protein
MIYTKNGALDAARDFSNDKNKSEGFDSSSLADALVPIVSMVSQDNLKPVLTFLMLADYTDSDWFVLQDNSRHMMSAGSYVLQYWKRFSYVPLTTNNIQPSTSTSGESPQCSSVLPFSFTLGYMMFKPAKNGTYDAGGYASNDKTTSRELILSPLILIPFSFLIMGRGYSKHMLMLLLLAGSAISSIFPPGRRSPLILSWVPHSPSLLSRPCSSLQYMISIWDRLWTCDADSDINND